MVISRLKVLKNLLVTSAGPPSTLWPLSPTRCRPAQRTRPVAESSAGACRLSFQAPESEAGREGGRTKNKSACASGTSESKVSLPAIIFCAAHGLFKISGTFIHSKNQVYGHHTGDFAKKRAPYYRTALKKMGSKWQDSKISEGAETWRLAHRAKTGVLKSNMGICVYAHRYMHISIYIYTYMYTYIRTYMERGRESAHGAERERGLNNFQ